MNADGYASDQERTYVDGGFAGCGRDGVPAPTKYGRGVVTPHASFLALDFAPREALANLAKLRAELRRLRAAAGSTTRSTSIPARCRSTTSRSTRGWSWPRSPTSSATTACRATSRATSGRACGRCWPRSGSRQGEPGEPGRSAGRLGGAHREPPRRRGGEREAPPRAGGAARGVGRRPGDADLGARRGRDRLPAAPRVLAGRSVRGGRPRRRRRALAPRPRLRRHDRRAGRAVLVRDRGGGLRGGGARPAVGARGRAPDGRAAGAADARVDASAGRARWTGYGG